MYWRDANSNKLNEDNQQESIGRHNQCLISDCDLGVGALIRGHQGMGE